MLNLDTASLSYFDVPAFIMDVDQEGRAEFSVVNDRWAEGARRDPKEVVGKSAIELFGGHLGKAAHLRHMEVIRTAKKMTYDIVLPVGELKHHFRTTLMPIADEKGRVIQLLGMSFDRTAEVEGAEIQARAASANEEIESFISLAAHDLRTPMQNIKSLANMLREDFVDHGDGKIELIDILETVAVKATALVTDVLAQAQASTAEKLEEIFNVAQLSNDILVTLDPLSQHKLNIDNKWVSSDKTAVQIALRNLCDNAIKHCGQDVVELSIDVSPLGQEVLEFSVQDNGVGFDDPAVAFLDGGKLRMDSGFGLFGVRRLINSRGGEIRAENLDGKQGSIIRFTMEGRMAQSPLN